MNAGLPADFKQEDLKMIQNTELPLSQWIYTGGDNAQFVYVIGGPPAKGSFVAKLDAKTLEVLQKFPLSPALYIGGLLMHTNGHVYCMHSNKLIVFWNGDLTTYKMLKLPSSLNGNIIQTNGMLVTQDGYIVVKQWDLIFEDILLAIAAKPYVAKIFFALFVVFGTISFGLKSRSNGKLDEGKQSSFLRILVSSALIGAVLGFIGWFAVVVSSFTSIVGSFNPARYFSSNLLFYGAGGGELKIIDPVSFEVVADMHFTERCSFARMALVNLTNSQGQAEDAIGLLGDENVYQVRWNPSTKTLSQIPSWTRQYRRRGDGSFPGTGPSIYREQLYFTDNTFPVFLSGSTYSMFSTPLNSIDGRPITPDDYLSSDKVNAQAAAINSANFFARISYKPAPFPPLRGHKVMPQASGPGFMFWSTAVSPLHDDIIVWDTAGRSVQARDAEDISKISWEIKNIIQADCVSIAADRGHIYMSDYNFAPVEPNEWLEAVSKESNAKEVMPDKFFIVADVKSGHILGNLTISTNDGLQASLVVPGANNDVFIGTKNGLTRVYV